MIKFTMGSSGSQKTQRRKPKRSTKSYTGYQNAAGGGGLSVPAVGLKSTVLPSSSLPTSSAAVSSCGNTSGDSSKLMFSQVINTSLIFMLGVVKRRVRAVRVGFIISVDLN